MGGASSRGTQADLDRRVKPAWDKQTLMVLYGPSTRVAAVDLESRFAEAALQDLFISDYRNFAHGRHNWLAKRPDSTAVLAFVTPDDREIASKTLSLFPDSSSHDLTGRTFYGCGRRDSSPCTGDAYYR